MTNTTTPNLGLVVEQGITAVSRQNLYKIDQLAATISTLVTGDVIVSSDNDIKLLTPENIYLGQASEVASSVKIYTNALSIHGTTTIAGLIYKYTDLDFTASSLTSILDHTAVISANTHVATAYGHAISLGNPHSTTAAQTGAYTTAQVDAIIATLVTNSSFSAHTAATSSVHGVSGTVVGTSDSQILTNKTLDAGYNSITNLTNSAISPTAAITYGKLDLTGSVTNTDVHASAGIDYSKLDLTGHITNTDIAASAGITYAKLSLGTSIVNSDIATSAAIAYSKLNLASSIVNADVAGAAAIAGTKISPDFGSQDVATTGSVKIGSAAKYVAISGAPSSGYSLTLPTSAGVAGQALGLTSSSALDWITIPGSALAQYNIIVGTLVGTSTAVNTNSVGDILADNTTGLTIKSKGNLTEATSSVLTIGSGTGAVLGSGTTIQVKQAGAAQAGYLSSADWTTFNAKEPAVSKGNLSEVTSSVLTISGGTGAVIGTGATIEVKQSGSGQAGYLSSADWSTFNGKQASDADLTAIAALSGPGFAVKTSTDPAAAAWACRSIAGTSNRISVSNGDGVSAGPTINLDTSLLPSPVITDTYALLAATGANASAWQPKVKYNGNTLWVNNNVYTALTPLATTAITAYGADSTDTRIAMSAFGTGVHGAFAGRLSRGTAEFPSAVHNGDILACLEGWGYGATGFSSAARASIEMKAAETWTDAAQGSKMCFFTSAIGAATAAERMRIYDDGGVQIDGSFGTSPGAGKLKVSGLLDTALTTNRIVTVTTGGELNDVALTNGQLLIGNTGNPPSAAALTGTANRLSATIGAGTITLNVDATQFPNSTAANDGLALVASSSANTATWRVPQSTIDLGHSGFVSWGGSGNYYTLSGGVFTILRAGVGRLSGTKITWAGGESVSGLAASTTYYIGYSATNTLVKIDAATIYSASPETYYDNMHAMMRDNVILFTVWMDSVTPIVCNEEHPYSYATDISVHDHFRLGHVFTGTGAVLRTLSSANATIESLGEDRLDDHGLDTKVPDSTGAALDIIPVFNNASGRAVRYNRRIFTVSGVSVTPTYPTTYTNNGSTFTVLHTSIAGGNGTIICWTSAGTALPQASGTLTKTGAGTGDNAITFSAYTSPTGCSSTYINSNVPTPLGISGSTRYGIWAVYITKSDLQTPSTAAPLPNYIWVPSSATYKSAASAASSLGAGVAPDMTQFSISTDMLAMELCLNGFVLMDGATRIIPVYTGNGFTNGVRTFKATSSSQFSSGAVAVAAAVNVTTTITNFIASGGVSSILSSSDVNAQLAFDTLARGKASRYSAALSWTGAGPYTMTITGATHLRGTDPIVRVRQFVTGTTYNVVMIDETAIDNSNGDVTLTSSENITGTVVIL